MVDHDLAQVQRTFDLEGQMAAVNEAMRPRPLTFSPLRTLAGAALAGLGLFPLFLFSLATFGGGS